VEVTEDEAVVVKVGVAAAVTSAAPHEAAVILVASAPREAAVMLAALARREQAATSMRTEESVEAP